MVEEMPAVLWTTDTELRFTSAIGAGLDALGLKHTAKSIGPCCSSIISRPTTPDSRAIQRASESAGGANGHLRNGMGRPHLRIARAAAARQ